MQAAVHHHQDALRLVRDLHQPRPAIYWIDLAVTGVLGWGAFAVALLARPFSIRMEVAIVIAALALYRGLCFVHEISHLRRLCLPGFETVWNLAFGIPLLLPSFVYVGVHPNHHNLATYGTEQDPEYLPFGSNHRMTVVFLAHSVLLPLAFLVRFLALAPVGLCWPRFHAWLVARASSLSMNAGYRRENSAELTAKVKHGEIAILLTWIAAFGFAWRHHFAWTAIAVWYAVNAFVSVCNALRTLGAHRYESTGEPLDRTAQLVDSIDTPGAAWTELWAPVGLRYHALHHYFPGIPYHNLGLAYRRLITGLPESAGYPEIRVRACPGRCGVCTPLGKPRSGRRNARPRFIRGRRCPLTAIETLRHHLSARARSPQSVSGAGAGTARARSSCHGISNAGPRRNGARGRSELCRNWCERPSCRLSPGWLGNWPGCQAGGIAPYRAGSCQDYGNDLRRCFSGGSGCPN